MSPGAKLVWAAAFALELREHGGTYHPINQRSSFVLHAADAANAAVRAFEILESELSNYSDAGQLERHVAYNSMSEGRL